MKRIKEVEAECFYVFTGRSNANSCFIETVAQGELFLTYANSYLKNYLKVYDYVINRDGWMMVVKVKSEEKLLSLKKNGTEKNWRIISERMRLFLGTFARVSNKLKGRTGCLVHNSYERYYFETLKEAMDVLKKIRNQTIKLYNGRKKYRGKKTHFKVSKTIGKGSIFLCSREVRNDLKGIKKFSEVLYLEGLTKLVVQDLVSFALNTHNSVSQTKKLPKTPAKNKNSS